MCREVCKDPWVLGVDFLPHLWDERKYVFKGKRLAMHEDMAKYRTCTKMYVHSHNPIQFPVSPKVFGLHTFPNQSTPFRSHQGAISKRHKIATKGIWSEPVVSAARSVAAVNNTRWTMRDGGRAPGLFPNTQWRCFIEPGQEQWKPADTAPAPPPTIPPRNPITHQACLTNHSHLSA